MKKKRLSIVVPVYNEEDNLQHFYEAVRQTMAGLDLDWEIIFVDDGSRDKSRAILARLEREDARVQPMLLARNYGHQLALTCGLDHADGDVVITMDGDMQHPPELIPALLKYWQEGCEVVQTIRDATRDASWIKRTTSAGYYKFLNLISEVPVQPGGSDFRLMDRKAVLAFRRYREHARFIRGLIGAMGFRQKQLHFTAPPRFAGSSKFSPRKMWRLAVDGVFIAIGHHPNTDLVKGHLHLDKENYIVTKHNSCETSIKGVFAAGDVRDPQYRQAIIAGLADGTIDIIATDHAPHSKEEKAKPITEAPSGIIGLETSLALGITSLVRPGHLSLIQLLEKMTINPAKLYHLPYGQLAEGKAADLVIFDENEWKQIQTVIDEALENIMNFRKDEGASLEKEFQLRNSFFVMFISRNRYERYFIFVHISSVYQKKVLFYKQTYFLKLNKDFENLCLLWGTWKDSSFMPV